MRRGRDTTLPFVANGLTSEGVTRRELHFLLYCCCCRLLCDVFCFRRIILSAFYFLLSVCASHVSLRALCYALTGCV